MKQVLFFIICVLIIILMQLATPADCVVVPVKPPIPAGCKDLVLECQCDSQGNNCNYIWKCVPAY